MSTCQRIELIFLVAQYRCRCASSVAEDSHPTSIVWLINKNTNVSAQIRADRCQGLSKQNGLSNSYQRQSVCTHELTPCWGLKNLIFLVHTHQYQCQCKQEFTVVVDSRTSIFGLIHITPRCQLINLIFLADQYQRRCISFVAEYSHPYLNCLAN